MGYVNDFTKIPLDQFKNKLKKRLLIPSQMILKEGIDSIFLIFEQMNIQNIGQLFVILNRSSLKPIYEKRCEILINCLLYYNLS